jgi:hypothetical protein
VIAASRKVVTLLRDNIARMKATAVPNPNTTANTASSPNPLAAGQRS